MLCETYRPRTLSDVVGQPEATENLIEFASGPYPAAFVFHGPTGTGKTCSGLALAEDLGCAVDEQELGGLYTIASGWQDGRAVYDLARSLRLRPMFGSGWKVAIVNEADQMTRQAETTWLDTLENLPPKSVIVFTTNDLSHLSERFLGRCELIAFRSDETFESAIAERCQGIWTEETGEPSGPVVTGRVRDTASMRAALKQLESKIRRRRAAAAA